MLCLIALMAYIKTARAFVFSLNCQWSHMWKASIVLLRSTKFQICHCWCNITWWSQLGRFVWVSLCVFCEMTLHGAQQQDAGVFINAADNRLCCELFTACSVLAGSSAAHGGARDAALDAHGLLQDPCNLCRLLARLAAKSWSESSWPEGTFSGKQFFVHT